MFDELTFQANRLNLLFEPQRVTSDFEKSLIKAVSNKVIKIHFICLKIVYFLLVPKYSALWMLLPLLPMYLPKDTKLRFYGFISR